jgi:hypothetical protein
VASLAAGLWLVLGCTIVGVPPVEVAGIVRGKDGRPIENATVALHMNFWAPLCCDWSGTLQLTRTGSDGTFRFVAGADRDFHFAVESRDYWVVAVAQGFAGDRVWATTSLAEPIEITLEPRRILGGDYTGHDCLRLCPTIEFAECRRAAEFHFGDKTRCDKWREDFW